MGFRVLLCFSWPISGTNSSDTPPNKCAPIIATCMTMHLPTESAGCVFSRLIRIHCTPIHRHSLPKSVGLLHLCVLVCCENGLGLSNFSILASFVICCGPMVGLARWTDFESYRYRHLGAQQTLARPRTTCLKIDG